MELWDILEFATPVYVVLALLGLWTHMRPAARRRFWRVHAPVAWLVGIVLAMIWWNASGGSGALTSLPRLLEDAIVTTIAVGLPLIPATIAISLPRGNRAATCWRIIAWGCAIVIAFYTVATALNVHCWLTGDCL